MAVTEMGSGAPGSLLVALREAAEAMPEIGDPLGPVPREVRVADLADAPRTVAALLRATGAADPRARAAWLLHGHAWRAAAPAIACVLIAGRAPDTGPRNVALHVDAAGAARMRLVDPERAVAGPEGLRAALTANLAVVAALPQVACLGARARWSLAGDAVAAAALHVGRRLAGPADAVRLAEILAGGPGPMAVPLGLTGADPAAAGEIVRRRASCCLAHREGLDLCPGCPRRGAGSPAQDASSPPPGRGAATGPSRPAEGTPPGTA